MAVIEGINSSNKAEVGAAAQSGQHIICKPIDCGSLGHYRLARRLAPASTTLTGILWAFRWGDATRLAVIQHIKLTAIQVAAPTAAIEDRFNITIARGYTASETTGAAAITPAANMQELRTSMGTSLATVIQEANIAAGLSGGTRTLDTNPIVTGSVWVLAALPTAAGQPGLVMEYKPDISAGEYPLTLAQNEGFVIQNENNFGATSGIVLHVAIAWAEVTAF